MRAMPPPDQVKSFVVDAIARWAERQVAQPYPPRMDFRVVFGGADIVAGVQSRLAESTCAWFAVRSSGDADAVKLRNGLPPKAERPASIPACRRLEDYGGFLLEARVPEDEWQATLPIDRAARMLRRWGEALPQLSM